MGRQFPQPLYRRPKRKEESDGKSLQTSKAAANGTAPQKPELHRTIEEAADGEAEEILYPISFQQRCKRTSSGCLLEIETDVPIHARMRAALAGLDQGEFTEGHELDRKWKIAKAMIGRRLSQAEAKRWLAKFE